LVARGWESTHYWVPRKQTGLFVFGFVVTARSCPQAMLVGVVGGGVWVEKCIVDASICSPARTVIDEILFLCG
jgi:hypothetical protein